MFAKMQAKIPYKFNPRDPFSKENKPSTKPVFSDEQYGDSYWVIWIKTVTHTDMVYTFILTVYSWESSKEVVSNKDANLTENTVNNMDNSRRMDPLLTESLRPN